MHANVKLPQDFLTQIESIMPPHLSMDDFVAICKQPLRRSIRVNTLKISVDDFIERAQKKGWYLHPIPWCETGFWLDAPEVPPIGNTAEHMAGLFYIQEASSMMPVSALFYNQVERANTVLDVAAAPGSKTTQIAAEMENNGLLVANEFSSSRIKVLSANIQRCGIRNVAMTKFDGRVFGSWLPETFDAVLLDAPCSGEGAIRKDVDAMSNWSLQAISDMASTQKDLIESAFHALKPGGVLIYSTCTLNIEENQNVCHHLKQAFPNAVEFERLDMLFPNASKAVTDEGFLHVFPQIFDSEGFFVARIRKTQAIPAPEVEKRLGVFPFTKASAKLRDTVTKALSTTLDISLPSESQIWSRDNEIWLFPRELEPLIGQLRFDRMGIKLAITHKTGYRWQHEAVMALATGKERSVVDLSITQAREWYMGRDVFLEHPNPKGEVIVTLHGDVIGLGKWVGNRVKNGLPRDIVRDGNLF